MPTPKLSELTKALDEGKCIFITIQNPGAYQLDPKAHHFPGYWFSSKSSPFTSLVYRYRRPRRLRKHGEKKVFSVGTFFSVPQRYFGWGEAHLMPNVYTSLQSLVSAAKRRGMTLEIK